jgi:hypothetical protein
MLLYLNEPLTCSIFPSHFILIDPISWLSLPVKKLQTNLYHTEISLSESWRARSKTRSGFDVASVTASIALGKLQSANRMATILGNFLR